MSLPTPTILRYFFAAFLLCRGLQQLVYPELQQNQPFFGYDLPKDNYVTFLLRYAAINVLFCGFCFAGAHEFALPLVDFLGTVIFFAHFKLLNPGYAILTVVWSLVLIACRQKEFKKVKNIARKYVLVSVYLFVIAIHLWLFFKPEEQDFSTLNLGEKGALGIPGFPTDPKKRPESVILLLKLTHAAAVAAASCVLVRWYLSKTK